ncbi:MAG: ChaN family lipoprotein, partial [Haliscomenobacter sp.]
MKKFLFTLFLGAFCFPLFSQHLKPAYRLFDQDGREVSYADVLKKAEKADVLFFGEQHNNPICHWLQLEMTRDLYEAKNGKLLLGAEMFERDNQLLMDEYLRGTLTQKSFEEEAR